VLYYSASALIALPITEIISLVVEFWGSEHPILGRGGCRGWGMVPFGRALVSSYRPSIATFPLSLRVSEIPIESVYMTSY